MKKKHTTIQKKQGRFHITSLLLQISVFLILLLTSSLIWTKNNFGNISFDEIVFHLNVPLKGVSENFLISYLKQGLLPAVLVWSVEIGLSIGLWKLFLKKRNSEGRKNKFILGMLKAMLVLLLLGCLGYLFWEADHSFDFFSYMKNQFSRSTLIKEEYVDPRTVTVTFPEKKRNLICIFIESGETSAQDQAHGGLMEVNYIPEFTKIAEDNISFSQSELLEGAAVAPGCNWTIAGLLAETSGLPLKIYSAESNGTNNHMSRYEYFMPGIWSIGDILEAEGYKNFFMAGSDFRFGGRKNYFTQHGSYEIWDYLSAKKDGKIPEDYKVWWGFEDHKLYEYAKEKLLEIAEGEQPFNFSVLTVDTHHQNGYVCELCENTHGADQYGNVWSCASRQLDAFVSWIQEQDFYKNTTIYISGDHCSMDSDFYGENTKDDYLGQVKRKVYNAFVHSAKAPYQEKNRRFTTLDMFPTVLASIGVEIEGERLGLGTNLFADTETLSEKYGYPLLFEELSKKSTFYDSQLLYCK